MVKKQENQIVLHYPLFKHQPSPAPATLLKKCRPSTASVRGTFLPEKTKPSAGFRSLL